MRALTIRLTLLALLGVAGCGAPTILPGLAVKRIDAWAAPPEATVLQLDTSQFVDLTEREVGDPGAWSVAWSQAWPATGAAPAPPAIDFVLASVLVMGLGRRPTTGYDVTIDSVVEFTSGDVLFATEHQPGPGCPVAQTPTAPVDMVVIASHPLIGEWRLYPVVRDCPGGASRAPPDGR